MSGAVITRAANRFIGPIISTHALTSHRALLGDVFGLECLAEQQLDNTATQAVWNVKADTTRMQLCLTRGTCSGALLLQFDPLSDKVIRDRSRGDDHDALKVIDFYTSNFDESIAKLAAGGHRIKDTIAEYDMDEGHFREAHLWADDQVVYALIDGPADFMARVVQISDRPFSEIMSVSTPVTERAEVVRFYSDVLQLNEVYRYGFDDESFAELVGGEQQMQLTALNMGTTLREPYFGLIHYGLRSDGARSLADESRLPHRGIAGALMEVTDLQQCLRRADDWQGAVVKGPTPFELAPLGKLHSALVRAPHGVLHQLIQRC